MNDSLAYYSSHSPLTDPGRYADLFNDLPEHPTELAGVVQGLLLHKLAVEHYKVTISRVQRSEQMLRSVAQRLERMVEFDPSPLVEQTA